MPLVVVDVMPKPAILDPQGQAIAGALDRLGYVGFTNVRQGKRFELEVDGEVTSEHMDQIRHAAHTLLANTVIEDFTVRVVEEGGAPHAGDDTEDTVGAPDGEAPKPWAGAS